MEKGQTQLSKEPADSFEYGSQCSNYIKPLILRKSLVNYLSVNHFLANVLILYPFKTTENKKGLLVFSGGKNGNIWQQWFNGSMMTKTFKLI